MVTVLLVKIQSNVILSAIKNGEIPSGREYSVREVVETSDFLAIVNITYKPGTDDRYMEFNVVKRRRIDSSESEFAKFTYLAHPFAKNNGLRLVDDVGTGKILSLQSLVSDIDVPISKEKTNAIPRLKSMEVSDFDEDDII